MSEKSPVVSALSAIAIGRPDVIVHSYLRDFDCLWGVHHGGSFLSGMAKEMVSQHDALTWVVVWDGIPPGKTGAVNTSRYLTPVDWAVALSLAIDEAVAEGEEYPPVRLLILDLASQNVSGADSVKFIQNFPKRAVMSMPWIRIFRPVSEDGKQWDAGNLITNIADISKRSGSNVVSIVSGQTPTMREVIANEKPDLGVVKRIWASSLTKPSREDDHHALANLIGPLLLLGDPDSSDAHVLALWSLMQSVGLFQNEDGIENDASSRLTKDTSWINLREEDWQQKLEQLGKGDIKLKLLVLDDQWRQGWGEVVCKAVGVTYAPPEEADSTPESKFRETSSCDPDQHICVKACNSADWLVDQLNALLNDTTDSRFKLRLDDDEECQEILFLDLRLFSGQSVGKEAEFIEKLVVCAEEIQGSETGKLPWPGFDAVELEDISNWARDAKFSQSSDARKDTLYHKALTLLPRLISLIDLSYPIILFSSTGRRDIVDKFKEYGNIITNFDKPRLSGTLSGDIASQTKANFQLAMDQSFSLLNARNRCLAFFNAKDPYENVIRPEIKEGRAYHVEFYVDETDPMQQIEDRPTYRKGWRVGGCYALFDGGTEEEAKEKADQFEDELVRNGVRYFEWPHNGAQPKAILQKKKYVCHQHIKSALDSSQDTCRPVCLGVASLYQRVPQGRDENVNLFDPRHDDQLFLTTLSALVEAFLYESVPALIGDRLPSISLFAGTRINVIKNTQTGNKSVEIARQEQYRTGVSWEPFRGNSVAQDTFCNDDFSPLIRNVIRMRERRNIYRALAVQLVYAEKSKQPNVFACRSCESTIVMSNREKEICNKQVKVGQIFQGTVKKRVSSGFIVEVYPGVKGLVCESDVFPENEVNVGGNYCGTVVRILPGGSVLVDFGADSWGRLPVRYVPRDVGIGDQFNVTLKKRFFDEKMRRMCNDLVAYRGELGVQSADTGTVDGVMQIGSSHLVKVISKQSSELRLSIAAAMDALETDVVTLKEPTTCQICDSVDNVYPDHRALHYVADQVLTDLFGNGKRKYESVFTQLVPGEFEEGWDEGFPDVLEASRALDIAHSDISKAVAVFPLDAKRKCIDPEGKNTKPAIRDCVRWRIGRALAGIDGKEFIRITQRITASG